MTTSAQVWFRYSDDSKRYYYFDTATNATTYDHPANAYILNPETNEVIESPLDNPGSSTAPKSSASLSADNPPAEVAPAAAPPTKDPP
jgi:hypothetical protein